TGGVMEDAAGAGIYAEDGYGLQVVGTQIRNYNFYNGYAAGVPVGASGIYTGGRANFFFFSGLTLGGGNAFEAGSGTLFGCTIAGCLTGSTLASSLEITQKLAHTLQAGADTYNYSGGGAVNLKSSRNPANNVGTAYAATGTIHMIYDSTGPYWLDKNQ